MSRELSICRRWKLLIIRTRKCMMGYNQAFISLDPLPKLIVLANSIDARSRFAINNVTTSIDYYLIDQGFLYLHLLKILLFSCNYF